MTLQERRLAALITEQPAQRYGAEAELLGSEEGAAVLVNFFASASIDQRQA